MNKMRSVGDILRKAREERNLNYEDVSKELKIHPRFLRALEAGDYSEFGGAVHIKGFLKNYAEFLKLNVSQLLAFWRREYEDSSEPVEIEDVATPLKGPRITVTPGVILTAGIFFLVTVFLGYLFWQYRSIAGPPRLEVSRPAEDLVTEDPVITLTGNSDPQAQLEINSKDVLIDEQGKFSYDYVLSPGTNTLEFVARNDFGKETRKVRRVIFNEQEQPFDESVKEATPSSPSAKPGEDS
ncbi:MAG: helix-turn-helix domain-containing protein [Patescibacteria group bacterium]